MDKQYRSAVSNPSHADYLRPCEYSKPREYWYRHAKLSTLYSITSYKKMTRRRYNRFAYLKTIITSYYNYLDVISTQGYFRKTELRLYPSVHQSYSIPIIFKIMITILFSYLYFTHLTHDLMTYLSYNNHLR